MIDKAILDEVLPVPELETLKEEKIAELKEEGFAITNFHSGGVFYTLLLIALRIKIEFTELLRAILNNMTMWPFSIFTASPWSFVLDSVTRPCAFWAFLRFFP